MINPPCVPKRAHTDNTMSVYTPPSITDLGSVAQLTADSGENTSSDTIFRLNGRTSPGIGGSIDSCNFGADKFCLPGDNIPSGPR